MSQTTATRFDEDVFLWCEHSGMSAQQIAERFGVSSRTVVRWRNRMHLGHIPRHEPHPPEDREVARRLLDDGCSISETAKTVGVSRPTIRRWFPDATPWTKQQASQHAAFTRRMNRTIERNAA